MIPTPTTTKLDPSRTSIEQRLLIAVIEKLHSATYEIGTALAVARPSEQEEDPSKVLSNFFKNQNGSLVYNAKERFRIIVDSMTRENDFTDSYELQRRRLITAFIQAHSSETCRRDGEGFPMGDPHVHEGDSPQYGKVKLYEVFPDSDLTNCSFVGLNKAGAKLVKDAVDLTAGATDKARELFQREVPQTALILAQERLPKLDILKAIIGKEAVLLAEIGKFIDVSTLLKNESPDTQIESYR